MEKRGKPKSVFSLHQKEKFNFQQFPHPLLLLRPYYSIYLFVLKKRVRRRKTTKTLFERNEIHENYF
jgi:hypothetical protein